MRSQFLKDHRQEYALSLLCETLDVSISGDDAWQKPPMSQQKPRRWPAGRTDSSRFSCQSRGIRQSTSACRTASSGDPLFPQASGSSHARARADSASASASEGDHAQRSWRTCGPESLGSRLCGDSSQRERDRGDHGDLDGGGLALPCGCA
jgi:hypothetical protein